MKKLDEYFKLQKEIYDYFGYVEDWVVIPINNCIDFFWQLNGEGYNSEVRYSLTKEDLFNNKGNNFVDSIYTQRFLKKWVYRGKDYTMICCDPHVDGNKFLRVFDNKKEIK